MVGELATCSSLFKITVVTKMINFVSFFQPRTEMRGEFLEILQDRLQGDAVQLHPEAVPHTPHKSITFIFVNLTNFFACDIALTSEDDVTYLMFVGLWSIAVICSHAPYFLFNCGFSSTLIC